MERVRRYEELASGLCVFNPRTGDYEDADESFDLTPEGFAVSRRTQHQLIVSPVLGDPEGALDLRTPEGRRLRSSLLALNLFNRASGSNLLVAEVSSAAVGRLVSSNTIIFSDAFDGFDAEVRIVNAKGEIHQDVLVNESLDLQALAAAGFPAADSVLEIWTEYVEAPAPLITARVVEREENPVKRAAMVEPDLVTEDLDFGVMKMPSGVALLRGSAMSEGASEARAAREIIVSKRWLTISGRRFIVESISLHAAERMLAQLPVKTGATTALLRDGRRNIRRAPPTAEFAQQNGRKIQLALGRDARDDSTEATPSRNWAVQSALHLAELLAGGTAAPRVQLVLDPVTVNGNLTNYTFKGDTTYHITGNTYLYDAGYLEGGAVLKFGTNVSLSLSGPLHCRTASYLPAVLTAKDDDSVGEVIAGSTGNPSGYYAKPALSARSIAQPPLEYLRIAYAQEGITRSVNAVLRLNHVQMVNCLNGVGIGYLGSLTLELRNALFANVRTNLNLSLLGGGATITAEHVTFASSSELVASGPVTGYGLRMTNCIFANVTNTYCSAAYGFYGNCNGFYDSPVFGANPITSPSNPFHRSGAGAHYLTSNSTFRNAGATNINTTLLADLRQRTTFPPLIQSNVTVAADTTLSPVVQCDTDTPDLGYHYDAIDFIAYRWGFSNCTLTIAPGTAIAYYDDTGLWMRDGASLVCEGTALALNRLVDYRTVQEQPVKLGSYSGASSGFAVNPYRYNSVTYPARFHFTQFSRLASGYGAYNFYINSGNWAFSELDVADCAFHGGTFSLWARENVLVRFQNNLLARTVFQITDYDAANVVSLRNNLLLGGTLDYDAEGSTIPTVKDNAFDGTSIDGWSDPDLDHSHNAYINSTGRLYPTNANDMVLTNFLYASGPLGNYYQLSTNLFNQGSQTADLSGLYHHTTTTNLVTGLQIKETNSVVDIGYHYVAVDSDKQPVDTDGDGLADYLEDWDGDGDVDSGETDWQDAADLGLRVRITRPKPNSVLP